MPGVSDIPGWYVVPAVLISMYQAYRGFRFQFLLADHFAAKNGLPGWTRVQKIFLLCIADMLTYLISTLAGFVALFMSYYTLIGLPSSVEIGAGLLGLLTFLVVFGVLGVCGKLPDLMNQVILLVNRDSILPWMWK